MARRPRLNLVGYPLHVIQRGVNRARCFFVQRDYELYLALLDELAPMFACSIHAYVLMTNHLHLLFTPEQPRNASTLMKNVGQRYTQYINRTHGRSGTLWQGRFKASIVDSEAYLLQCHRYIELNPVRAGMVTSPADYGWSSYRVNAESAPSTIVVPHERYLALGQSVDERAARYRDLVREALTSEELKAIRDAVNGGLALGGRAFLHRIAAEGHKRARVGLNGRPHRSSTRETGV